MHAARNVSVPMATKKPRVGVFALGLVLWRRIEAARTPPMPPTTTGQYRKTCGMVKMARQRTVEAVRRALATYEQGRAIQEVGPAGWREVAGFLG